MSLNKMAEVGAEEDLHIVDATGLKRLKEVVSTTLDNKLPDFLEIITDRTLSIFATQLNSVQMITKATHNNPDFHQIFIEFKSSVKFLEGLRAVEQRCRQLLEALDKCGGPVKDAANTLAQEWSRKVWDELGISFIQRQPYQPSTDISLFDALHLPQPTQLPPHPRSHAVYIPPPTASVTPPHRVTPNLINKIRHQMTHEPQFAEQLLQALAPQLNNSPSFQNAYLNTVATAPPKRAGTLLLPGIQSEVNVASLSSDGYSTEAVPASVSGDEHNSQHVPSSYMSPYQQGIWTDLSYRPRHSFSNPPHESAYLPGDLVAETIRRRSNTPPPIMSSAPHSNHSSKRNSASTVQSSASVDFEANQGTPLAPETIHPLSISEVKPIRSCYGNTDARLANDEFVAVPNQSTFPGKPHQDSERERLVERIAQLERQNCDLSGKVRLKEIEGENSVLKERIFYLEKQLKMLYIISVSLVAILGILIYFLLWNKSLY